MSTLLRKNIFAILIVSLVCILLTVFPMPWQEKVEDFLTDIHFAIRGDRPISDKYLLVFIGDEDLHALGGWPITRDYYSYLIHILKTSGAKVIGIDILFSRPDYSHPEFDRLLSQFLNSNRDVCLPMKFAELEVNSGHIREIMKGYYPTFPLDIFVKDTFATGFSNLGGVSRTARVPLVATYKDRNVFSFGTHLGRQYLGGEDPVRADGMTLLLSDSLGVTRTIPLDGYGQIHLNHFGGLDQVNTISFTRLLKIFNEDPSKLHLSGKLVLLAVTAQGIAYTQITPAGYTIPSSLIHLTVAENLIEQNYIRDFSSTFQISMIILSAIGSCLLLSINKVKIKVLSFVLIFVGFWLFSVWMFTRQNQLIPLFFPSLVFLVSFVAERINGYRYRAGEASRYKILLQEQVSAKEEELIHAKRLLENAQDQLAESEQRLKEKAEQQKSILQLETELSDLRTYLIPEINNTIPEVKDFIFSGTGRMHEIIEMAAKVSRDNIPVLISGETGTGKEMLARFIHRSSDRKDARFVAVNCGALSESLLDSELFGHEKGSFTGANTRRRGRIELADGGTIFLDEITETSPAFQARLLRVLQEGTFERVGGEKTIKVNIRVIAATNRIVQREIAENRFRSDLFYRLNGIALEIPPLRERIEDIPLLVAHFIAKHGDETGISISDQTMQIFQTYSWPGNIRELENVIRRAILLAKSAGRAMIQRVDLPPELFEMSSPSKIESIHIPFEEQILDMLRAMKFSRSSVTQTAIKLGNKDRGTITEYFRGMCFEYLVKADFQYLTAATQIAGSDDPVVIAAVQQKLEQYIDNIRRAESFEPFKGLPKKYHIFLQQIIDHLVNPKK